MENPTTLSSAPAETPAKKVNWKQVGAFVGLTFVLTWLLDLALFLTGGLKSPAVGLGLQLQMLLPAFSAILLGMFFFKDSPINVKTNRGKSRWFTWYFLLFTLLYIAAFILVFIKSELVQTVSGIMLLPSLIGLVLVIVLRAVGGKDTFAGVGMGGGKPKLWLLYGLAVVLFTGLQTFMSWLFKMGQPVDLTALVAQETAATGMTAQVFLLVMTVQTIILGPFLGLLITFGEEYGWRGYLQPALYGLGRVRAVTLVGLIWGVWHWPVIWMGYNYPGHPYLGSLLMLLFSLGLAFLLGYAVLKARGVWIAAFLHALVNQSFSFFMGFIYAPGDPAYAFGLGIPGLVVLALLVALVLRDPVWKQSE
ncbi:MAG: CPBP family intramembrane glutamic endopeptidase [Anaerolineaceae bacterium]